jgi:hypothetical protein
MQQLGGRTADIEALTEPGETLQDVILRALNKALDTAVAADIYAIDDEDGRGLCARREEGSLPERYLSLDDAARIAAAEAHAWF